MHVSPNVASLTYRSMRRVYKKGEEEEEEALEPLLMGLLAGSAADLFQEHFLFVGLISEAILRTARSSGLKQRLAEGPCGQEFLPQAGSV